MLGLEEAAQASPGQNEPASDALGQQPARSASPNGARQNLPHALHPAKVFRPIGALHILGFQTQGGARPSLALGWLVKGLWPQTRFLRRREDIMNVLLRALR